MTNATPVVMDTEKSKLAAHAIKKRFEELNTPIKLNHAYEALAIAHRFPNWATMKASQTDKLSKTAITQNGDFVIGTFVRYEGGNRIDEPFSIPVDEALNHIHGFSTSHEARHDLLRGLSSNAMRMNTSSVFLEAVSDAGTKSKLINDMLRHVTRHGRRDDFFVLDLSVEGSRLGNTCNILEAMSNDDRVEFLLHGFHHNSSASDHSRLTLAYCVERVWERKLSDPSSIQMNIESVCGELSVLETEGYPQVIIESQENSFSANTYGLPGRLIKHLQRFAEQHHRLLDQDSSWTGFKDIFRKPQTVLIFIDNSGSELTALFHRIVVKAIKAAIMYAPAMEKAPDMLLLNDVDFLERGLAERAARNSLCLVVADQCPMPPHQFLPQPVSFKSEIHKNGSDAYSHHELLTDTGERKIWPGWLPKKESE